MKCSRVIHKKITQILYDHPCLYKKITRLFCNLKSVEETLNRMDCRKEHCRRQQKKH